MRKLSAFIATSLDGYFEGSNQEIDWHNVDDEFNQFAIDQINTIDTMLFGRRTYELMASYWPTPQAQSDDPEIAEKMNSYPKFVFSKSIPDATWQNTTLLRDAETEVSKLKQQSGKGLMIFGSVNLVGNLAKSGLIDEFRILVMPVALGEGHSLFGDLGQRLN
jgi:dihydrofolate reductase